MPCHNKEYQEWALQGEHHACSFCEQEQQVCLIQDIKLLLMPYNLHITRLAAIR